MAEKVFESIPQRMTTNRLANLASMSGPDFLELVWENGEILIRGLSSEITKKNRFPCSGYVSQSDSQDPVQVREGETSTANRSKDGVADSTFGDPLSGLSGTTKLDRRDKKKINSYPNYTLNNYLEAGYPEQLSELYEDDINVVPEPNKNCYDQKLMDSHVVPVNQFKSSKQSYASTKLVEEIPQQTVNSNSEVPQSSLKQGEACVPFMISKEQNSRNDERREKVNFSIFLRSPALLKSTHRSSGATKPTSSPGLEGAVLEGNVRPEDLKDNARSAPGTRNPADDMILVEPTNGSKYIRSVEKEGNSLASNMKPILPDSEPQKESESLPDEQSEAVGYKDTPSNTRFRSKVGGPSSNLAIKENPGNGKAIEQMVPSSSGCSRGASNYPTYTLKRRYEDTDLSENAMEEPEGTTKAAPARGTGAKRKRKAAVHNLSERRRRDKINKKMRALQELIPNCNKVDKASMLDEAIEYLKNLQFQVQMMSSMGTGVFMPPMMLPTVMQQMNAQHMAGYSPMAVGMGMRTQMGLGCSPAQFPTTSLFSGAAAALPMEARLNMLGIPGQLLLRSPFASLAGRFNLPSVQAPAGVFQPPAAQGDVPAAGLSPFTTKDSSPTCY